MESEDVFSPAAVSEVVLTKALSFEISVRVMRGHSLGSVWD